jgi:sugar lactone lactonase YvrE
VKGFVFGAEHSDQTCSFLNDIVVDNDSGFAYRTDSGIFCDPLDGGLIVYDSRNNTARRVLDATLFTNDDPNFFFNIGDRPVLKNGRMRTGADGIALSGDKRTL